MLKTRSNAVKRRWISPLVNWDRIERVSSKEGHWIFFFIWILYRNDCHRSSTNIWWTLLHAVLTEWQRNFSRINRILSTKRIDLSLSLIFDSDVWRLSCRIQFEGKGTQIWWSLVDWIRSFKALFCWSLDSMIFWRLKNFRCSSNSNTDLVFLRKLELLTAEKDFLNLFIGKFFRENAHQRMTDSFIRWISVFQLRFLKKKLFGFVDFYWIGWSNGDDWSTLFEFYSRPFKSIKFATLESHWRKWTTMIELSRLSMDIFLMNRFDSFFENNIRSVIWQKHFYSIQWPSSSFQSCKKYPRVFIWMHSILISSMVYRTLRSSQWKRSFSKTLIIGQNFFENLVFSHEKNCWKRNLFQVDKIDQSLNAHNIFCWWK